MRRVTVERTVLDSAHSVTRSRLRQIYRQRLPASCQRTRLSHECLAKKLVEMQIQKLLTPCAVARPRKVRVHRPTWLGVASTATAEGTAAVRAEAAWVEEAG